MIGKINKFKVLYVVMSLIIILCLISIFNNYTKINTANKHLLSLYIDELRVYEEKFQEILNNENPKLTNIHNITERCSALLQQITELNEPFIAKKNLSYINSNQFYHKVIKEYIWDNYNNIQNKIQTVKKISVYLNEFNSDIRNAIRDNTSVNNIISIVEEHTLKLKELVE